MVDLCLETLNHSGLRVGMLLACDFPATLDGPVQDMVLLSRFHYPLLTLELCSSDHGAHNVGFLVVGVLPLARYITPPEPLPYGSPDLHIYATCRLTASS